MNLVILLVEKQYVRPRLLTAIGARRLRMLAKLRHCSQHSQIFTTILATVLAPHVLDVPMDLVHLPMEPEFLEIIPIALNMQAIDILGNQMAAFPQLGPVLEDV